MVGGCFGEWWLVDGFSHCDQVFLRAATWLFGVFLWRIDYDVTILNTIVITHDGSMGLVYLPTIYHKKST